jgi:regulator of replication initiation timing
MEEIKMNSASPSLQEADKLALELAKMNKRLAAVNAEKALAQNETADLHYKYVVLQIYMKYGLTPNDSIDENGNILRGITSNEDK